jgi:hypothetical protein
MGIALISALSAIAGVIVGSLVNYVLDRSHRKEERSLQHSEQQLRLYAEFLSLASRWLMEINWYSRDAASWTNGHFDASGRRALENIHRETLIPYGMIRMTSTKLIEQAAQNVLELCHEHQRDLEAGVLTEEALWANHEKWVVARKELIKQARDENQKFLSM